MAELLPSRKFSFSGFKVWYATLVYLAYVVLGPISWKTHQHIYTGNPENLKSLRGLITNLCRGQLATFSKAVYEKYFFPAFLRYHRLYQVHTLCAGAWLISGVYNLRNQPQVTFVVNGRAVYSDGIVHQRIGGYIYAVTSLAKGITASALSLKSHSLGAAKWPMAIYGIWDAFSLMVAMRYIWQRNIPEHKRWMIRNFSIGAGSIWVRVFGAIWAACDLSFMTEPETYGRMNNIVLIGGFTQGWVFGEWWIARTQVARNRWFGSMLAVAAGTAMAARNMYRDMRSERKALEKSRVEGRPLRSKEERE